MFTLRRVRGAIFVALALVITAILSGCAAFGAIGDSFEQALSGVPATMTTYTQGGEQIDEINGNSFRITRDTKFDTTNSEGITNSDSSVLLISLGDSIISHVGSSLILAEDGLTDLSDGFGSPYVSLQNTEPGTPWLNTLFEQYQNLWQGSSKTILIRSQDGTPIAIFAGNTVEPLATDVPKSTWFRIDGRTLIVYRCDYTVYDNALLGARLQR